MTSPTTQSRIARSVASVDWPALGGIFSLYLVSRLALVLIGVLTQATLGDDPDASLIQLGCRWDCGWYLGIADHGYTQSENSGVPGATSFAFFPIFPLLMRGVATISGLGLLPAGLIVTNLCFLAALVYLHRYVLQLGFSRGSAMLSVALLCIIPQSFVFSAVYTESVFLLFLVAAMFHLRRGEFLRAGCAAALLSATRANGIFFLVFAIAWLVRRYGWPQLLRPWQNAEAYIPILLAPLGLFLWWAYCYSSTGDAFAQPTTVGYGWGWRGGFFLENLWWHLQATLEARFWVLSSLLIFGASTWLLRLRLYEEFIFCAAIFLLLW
ncbi:MAG: mannosyltransferase family protein, partial [Dokdonella sp.]